MTKTFKEIREIDGIVAGLYAKNETLKDSKFGAAYARFVEDNYLPIAKEQNREIERCRIDHALDDEKTHAILRDPTSPRQYQYSKEGLKKVIEDENRIVEEYEKKEVEIKPAISPFIPENLSELEKEKLTGVLI